MLIAGGVMASVVVIAVGFSSAAFTAQSSDPVNLIGTGEVKLGLSPTGAVIGSTSSLEPGDVSKGSVTVTNLGNRARLTLSVTGLTEGAAPRLSSVIVLTVRETAPASAERYRGALGDLTALDLGTWASGARRTYELEVAWPSDDTDPGLRGKQASFGFGWSGESMPP